ncbi:MAG: UDP-N-acetylmuramoyl-L-alanyl-D-glutamate--2,6-diaminopimelate ligase, partial [Gammaproteobacteria bacterium]|nr:UDP-N-acetylmuramoyl-L-alanyl-D-glutamate--2,6-diaminopimelate ligase [Gammaproteobacteria bacterium]
MLLSKLLAEITTVDPKLDCDISGLTADSRKIEPGFLFVALTGDVFDGHDYIAAATTAGAGAIICEREDIVRKDWQVPVMAISNLRQKVGMVAACFYGYPSRSMTVVGVTGTNGKTSVTQFLAAALEMSDISCGIIGTLGVGFPDRLNLGRHTTPDPISLQHELAEFREAGAKVVAMEVSSHALAQGRINGIDITIAVFTNLTRDHLDYHGNMGNYAETKKSLFLRPELQYAVINADDGFGKKLLTEAAPNKAEFFAYSLAAAHTTVPTLRAEDIQLTAKGITAQIVTPWSE